MPTPSNLTPTPQSQPFERRVEGIFTALFKNHAEEDSALALPTYVEGHSDMLQFDELAQQAALNPDPEGLPPLPGVLVAFYGSGYTRSGSQMSEDQCTLSVEIRTPRQQLAEHDRVVQALRVTLSADNQPALIDHHLATLRNEHLVQISGVWIEAGTTSTNAFEADRHNYLYQQSYTVRGYCLTEPDC